MSHALLAVLSCVMVALLNFTAQVFQKKLSVRMGLSDDIVKFSLLKHLILIFCILAVSMLFWIYTLSHLSLGFAYPLLSLVLVFSVFYECKRWSAFGRLKQWGVSLILFGILCMVIAYDFL